MKPFEGESWAQYCRRAGACCFNDYTILYKTHYPKSAASDFKGYVPWRWTNSEGNACTCKEYYDEMVEEGYHTVEF